MYNWTRPYISIPLHGEFKHMVAHSKLAQSCQVPYSKILENGKCIQLAPNEPKIYGMISTGKMIVEGKKLYDSESDFIKNRRKISFEGIFTVSMIIYKDYSIDKNIKISCNGFPEFDNDEMILLFKEKFINEYTLMNDDKKSLDKNISDLIKKTIRRVIKDDSNKKPEVNSHILRL